MPLAMASSELRARTCVRLAVGTLLRSSWAEDGGESKARRRKKAAADGDSESSSEDEESEGKYSLENQFLSLSAAVRCLTRACWQCPQKAGVREPTIGGKMFSQLYCACRWCVFSAATTSSCWLLALQLLT